MTPHSSTQPPSSAFAPPLPAPQVARPSLTHCREGRTNGRRALISAVVPIQSRRGSQAGTRHASAGAGAPPPGEREECARGGGARAATESSSRACARARARCVLRLPRSGRPGAEGSGGAAVRGGAGRARRPLRDRWGGGGVGGGGARCGQCECGGADARPSSSCCSCCRRHRHQRHRHQRHRRKPDPHAPHAPGFAMVSGGDARESHRTGPPPLEPRVGRVNRSALHTQTHTHAQSGVWGFLKATWAPPGVFGSAHGHLSARRWWGMFEVPRGLGEGAGEGPVRAFEKAFVGGLVLKMWELLPQGWRWKPGWRRWGAERGAGAHWCSLDPRAGGRNGGWEVPAGP